jgi:hypothetical protein
LIRPNIHHQLVGDGGPRLPATVRLSLMNALLGSGTRGLLPLVELSPKGRMKAVAYSSQMQFVLDR